jgi:hypothetical protein
MDALNKISFFVTGTGNSVTALAQQNGNNDGQNGNNNGQNGSSNGQKQRRSRHSRSPAEQAVAKIRPGSRNSLWGRALIDGRGDLRHGCHVRTGEHVVRIDDRIV